MADVFATAPIHVVGFCRASWAYVVRCFVRSRAASCAAQPSMMHVEGSTVMKIAHWVACNSRCTALYQPNPRDNVQLLGMRNRGAMSTETRMLLRCKPCQPSSTPEIKRTSAVEHTRLVSVWTHGSSNLPMTYLLGALSPALVSPYNLSTAALRFDCERTLTLVQSQFVILTASADTLGMHTSVRYWRGVP